MKHHQISYPSVKLFDLDFFQGSVDSCVAFLEQQMVFDSLVTICTPNPEQIVLQSKLSHFKKILGQFDVVIPDGIGVSLASKVLYNQSLPRISGIDVALAFLQSTSQFQKILIIGGREYQKYTPNIPIEIEGVFELTQLTKLHQVFWTEGYREIQNKESKLEDDRSVQSIIQTLKPDIIFVALGAPHQEQWVIENRDFLKKNQVKLVMVVGGAFDILIGKISRSSLQMRRLGLEWLYRLLQQPWRWKRQLALIQYIVLVGKKLKLVKSST